MELIWALYGTGFVLVALFFLIVAKKLFDLATPYSVDVQMTDKDNPAVGVVLAGYLLGVIAVICGSFAGDAAAAEFTRSQFIGELKPIAGYTAAGMLLLLAAGLVNDKLILRKFSNTKEIVDDRNTSVGVVLAASYLGSGLIVGGSIYGCHDPVSALSSFVLGQVALVVFAFVYQAATSYDDQHELGESQNLAAGIAFGGNLLAFSIIVMQGCTMARGQLVGSARLWHFGYYVLLGLILLPLLRIVNDRVFLPKGKLSEEIVRDRNTNAGLLAAGLAVSMGVILVFCL
jgi:uncharacterized membrane protein YjfL (UPF0719 family)